MRLNDLGRSERVQGVKDILEGVEPGKYFLGWIYGKLLMELAGAAS